MTGIGRFYIDVWSSPERIAVRSSQFCCFFILGCARRIKGNLSLGRLSPVFCLLDCVCIWLGHWMSWTYSCVGMIFIRLMIHVDKAVVHWCLLLPNSIYVLVLNMLQSKGPLRHRITTDSGYDAILHGVPSTQNLLVWWENHHALQKMSFLASKKFDVGEVKFDAKIIQHRIFFQCYVPSYMTCSKTPVSKKKFRCATSAE